MPQAAGHEGREPRPDAEWWRAFFLGSFGTLQLGGLREATAAAESAFLIEMLDLAPGSRVLDVPCGSGRHARVLAGHGIAVTGVDFNGKLISHAVERAEGLQPRPQFSVGDMRALSYAEEFDAAFCFWGSFGYFDPEGERAFARGVHASLAPGGKFLIDTPVIESLLPGFLPRRWWWLGEGDDRVRVVEELHYDLESGRLNVAWLFQRGTGEESHDVSMRLYTCQELCALLRSVGFSRFRLVETLSGKPFEIGSERLSLIAWK